MSIKKRPFPSIKKRGFLRPAMVWIHRYVGLSIAVFLIVAALTGSIACFKGELDQWTNPHLWRVSPPSPDAQRMDPLVLRAQLEKQVPAGIAFREIYINAKPADQAEFYWVDWKGEDDAPFDQLFVDPYTGKIIGTRNHLDITESWRNIFNWLFQLHYSLGLGEVGGWLLGIVALLWTIDCFVAMYLTFPQRQSGNVDRERRKLWLSRWAPSWLLKTNSMFRAIFTFHRASGLWVWAVLLMFAWSSVAMLMNPVYETVMSLFFRGYKYAPYEVLPQTRPNPRLSWQEGLVKCREHMELEGRKHGFTVQAPFMFAHEADFGFYTYRVQSSLDLDPRWCETAVRIDSDTGAYIGLETPDGDDAGSTFRQWLYWLHFGRVGSVAYRIFICLVGIITAVLCVTGVMIWWRKRKARLHAQPG